MSIIFHDILKLTIPLHPEFLSFHFRFQNLLENFLVACASTQTFVDPMIDAAMPETSTIVGPLSWELWTMHLYLHIPVAALIPLEQPE